MFILKENMVLKRRLSKITPVSVPVPKARVITGKLFRDPNLPFLRANSLSSILLKLRFRTSSRVKRVPVIAAPRAAAMAALKA